MFPLLAIVGLGLLMLAKRGGSKSAERWPHGTPVLIMPPANGKWPDGSRATHSVAGWIVGPDKTRTGYYQVALQRKSSATKSVPVLGVPESLLRYDGS